MKIIKAAVHPELISLFMGAFLESVHNVLVPAILAGNNPRLFAVYVKFWRNVSFIPVVLIGQVAPTSLWERIDNHINKIRNNLRNTALFLKSHVLLALFVFGSCSLLTQGVYTFNVIILNALIFVIYVTIYFHSYRANLLVQWQGLPPSLKTVMWLCYPEVCCQQVHAQWFSIEIFPQIFGCQTRGWLVLDTTFASYAVGPVLSSWGISLSA